MPSFCGPWLQRLPFLLAVIVVTTASSSVLNAIQADETKPAPEPPLFEVPDGSVAELQAFISKVKRTPAKERTAAASMAHLKLQIEAVLAACDRIMATEPAEATELAIINERFGALNALARVDAAASKAGTSELMKLLEADTRPAIVKLLAARKMQEKIRSVPSMSTEDRDAFIKEIFARIQEDGLSREMYSTASSVGRYLSSGKDTDAAAGFYEQLAEYMRKSDDEALSSRAERTMGAARRVRLPGNFMEIKGRTADGEDFDWAAYRGKVVLVDFWASWCGPCRREIPNMKAQLEAYGNKGFAIVGVNLDSSKEKYQAYVDAEALTWTNLMSDKPEEMGWDNPLAAYYGVSGIPTAILVDKEGKVVSMSARGTELNRLLAQLLGPAETSTDEGSDSSGE